MRTYAGFYECFGENYPPEIRKPRIFTGIRVTGFPNPTRFTVPAETRISGATYFCGFPGTGVPNMRCFSGILVAGGGPCPSLLLMLRLIAVSSEDPR